jgi:hypothetical protein
VHVFKHVVPLSVPPFGHEYVVTLPVLVEESVTAAHQLFESCAQNETPKPELFALLLVALIETFSF